MTMLSKRKCEPCSGKTPRLDDLQIEELQKQLRDWTVHDNHKLLKCIQTKNFMRSLELANKIGQIAEDEGHHPDLLVSWGQLKVELWTHAIDGLSEADFILAAKIDELIA